MSGILFAIIISTRESPSKILWENELNFPTSVVTTLIRSNQQVAWPASTSDGSSDFPNQYYDDKSISLFLKILVKCQSLPPDDNYSHIKIELALMLAL